MFGYTVARSCSDTHEASIIHLQSKALEAQLSLDNSRQYRQEAAFHALEQRSSQALKMAPRPAGAVALLPSMWGWSDSHRIQIIRGRTALKEHAGELKLEVNFTLMCDDCM